MFTQTNALTGKNRATAVHRGSLEALKPRTNNWRIINNINRIFELKTVDGWVVSMIFFAILNPDQSYPFQHDLKNIPNKTTSNMKAVFRQELQKRAYPSFSLNIYQYRLF